MNNKKYKEASEMKPRVIEQPIQSCLLVNRNGVKINRLEFESFNDLEQYFLEYLVGKPGIASKVIGTVLLWWRR